MGRLDGVKEARVGQSKFHYDLNIVEKKTLLPSNVVKLLDKMRKDSNGDNDYSYEGFVITAISGTVEKAGGEYVFTARGSNQKYALRPSEALKKLAAGGPSKVALAGKVTEAKEKDGKKPLPLIEVSEAKEAK